jgi:hypothetical protein
VPPYDDQQWTNIDRLSRETNDIIRSLRASYDANEAHRMRLSYPATAIPLHEELWAAAAMRDSIDRLADQRLIYLRRAHRAHMLRGA